MSYDYGDYNRGGMWAFVFSVLVTFVFFIYVAFVHSGIDLKEMDQDRPKVEKPDDGSKRQMQENFR